MNTTITKLGEETISSPLCTKYSEDSSLFIQDEDRILYNTSLLHLQQQASDYNQLNSFEQAGPRKKIFFGPPTTKIAIITCGGLCPGINDVIRSIVMEAHYGYGIKDIIGIQYGYNGLKNIETLPPINLTLEKVDDIHRLGGTILGSSRGGTEDMELLLSALVRLNVNILFTIGGDGTLKGAHSLAKLALEKGYEISIIGIPKTIDNDINYISKTFGFETAFSEARHAIASAHIEAKGAPNGIGLVKLMGRESGFIAVNATLSLTDVNFTLIPEVPFDLEGPNGFLTHLETRMRKRDHAVICVAEGAGQDILLRNQNVEYDASGNIKLADIGLFLKDYIVTYFKKKNIKVNLKYIDPSYMIRSAPANANDSIFCALLGQYAVHAAMAGKTDMIVALWNNAFVHLPIKIVTAERKHVSPASSLWYNLLQATGQPISMKN